MVEYVGNCPIHLHAIAKWEGNRSCVKLILSGCLWVTVAKLVCPITYLNNRKSILEDHGHVDDLYPQWPMKYTKPVSLLEYGQAMSEKLTVASYVSAESRLHLQLLHLGSGRTA